MESCDLNLGSQLLLCIFNRLNLQMEKIVIIGAGVAGVNAATKLVDNGYDGS